MPGSPEPIGDRLIDLRGAISSPIKRGIFRLVERPIEYVLAIPTVNRLFARSHRDIQGDDFFAGALRTLNVTYDLSSVDVAKIPPTGPLLVVANHPFGGIDGLIMGDILTRIRPDMRLFCNHLLARIPGLAPWIFPVNPFGGSAATASNFMPLRQAMKWLRQGGALATFPAGTVSHLQIGQGGIVDPPWHTSVASLARRTGATVVTLFFDGRNSMVFQLSGLIHPKLHPS
jgi:putative hemolysin